MDASTLNSLASAVYGSRWQSQLAREMEVGLRTVQRWASDGIDKPRTANSVRDFLEQRRRARIAAPPAGSSPGDARAGACCEALEPGVRALVTAAENAGWQRSEAVEACREALAALSDPA